MNVNSKNGEGRYGTDVTPSFQEPVRSGEKVAMASKLLVSGEKTGSTDPVTHHYSGLDPFE